MMGRRHTPETVFATLPAYPFAELARPRRQARRKSFNNATESDSQAENLGSDAISTCSPKGRTKSATQVVIAEKRTKNIMFYRNGDRFFKGKKVRITPHRFLNFTELLNNLTQSVSLPYGVRRIYTLEGKFIGNIEDLEDGKAYVCASFERFKQLNYGTKPLPDWTSHIKKSHAPVTIGQLSYGYSYPSTGKYASAYAKATDQMGRSGHDSLSYCRQKNKHVKATVKSFSRPSDANRFKPRLIKFVQYGSSPRKTISILLNRQTVFSFEQLLNVLNDAFDLLNHKNQKVCKLYTTKGKELKGVSAFFRETDSIFIAATSRQTLLKVEVEDILEEILPSKPPPEPVKPKKKIRDKNSKIDSGIEIDAAGDVRTLSARAELPLIKPTNHRRKKSVPIFKQSSNAEFTVRAKSCASPDREAHEKALAEDKWIIEGSALPKEELQERKEEKLGDQKDEERNMKIGHAKEEDLKKKIADKKKQMEKKQAELSRKEAEFKNKKEEFRRLEKRKEEEKKKNQEKKCKQKEEERKKEAKRILHKEKIEDDKKKEDKKRKENEKLKEFIDKQEKETIKEQEEIEENQRKKREEEKSVAKEEITVYDSYDMPHKKSDGQFDIPMEDSMTIFAAFKPNSNKNSEVVDHNVDVENSKLLTNTDDTKSVSPAKIADQNRFVPASRKIVHRNVILEKYDIGIKIGDGNFAEVHKSIRKICGKTFAMKIVYKSKLLGKEHMIANEIGIMHNIRHQNIVRLYEEYETVNHIYLLLEYVSEGDLFDAITESIKFTEADGAQIVGDMARALQYLHDLNIVHRDLKPENLLVSKSPSGDIMVKLADFGLAMVVTEPIFAVCGTPTYVAPEILSESGYGLEVDMWATGVITYILLCGFPPFRSVDRDQEELFQLIQAGEFEYISPYWDNISSDAKDLINQLLVVNQSRRFKADQVLSHPWIVNHNKSDDLPNLQREVSMNLERNFDGRRGTKSRMSGTEY